MMDYLYKAITVLALGGIAVASIMFVLKWLIDLGPLWSVVAISAGILLFIGFQRQSA